jgi:hypothetical protein
MTPKELIETIQNYTYRFYSCDTPADCQNKLIEILKEHFKEVNKKVKIVRTVAEMENLKSFDFDLIIVQNADQIINGLRSLESIENLVKSSAGFLIFFNGSVDTHILDKEKRNNWKALVKNAKYFYERSFECMEKPFPKPEPGESRYNRIKEIKTWTCEYLRREVRDFLEPPWTRLKLAIPFLVLIVAGLSKRPFFPFFMAVIITFLIAFAVLVPVIKTVWEKGGKKWSALVYIVFFFLNQFLGITIQDIFKFLLDFFESSGGK